MCEKCQAKTLTEGLKYGTSVFLEGLLPEYAAGYYAGLAVGYATMCAKEAEDGQNLPDDQMQEAIQRVAKSLLEAAIKSLDNFRYRSNEEQVAALKEREGSMIQ